MVIGRRGVSRLGCLTWLLLCAVGLYLATQFGEPWFRYQQYRDEMKTAISFGDVLTDQEIQRRVQARADSLGLPVEARKVVITRAKGIITLSAVYQEVVRLPWYGPVTLKFAPQFKAPL